MALSRQRFEMFRFPVGVGKTKRPFHEKKTVCFLFITRALLDTSQDAEQATLAKIVYVSADKNSKYKTP